MKNINKHGLECPISLEQWPDSAQYLAIDCNGSCFYESHPLWNAEYEIHDNSNYSMENDYPYQLKHADCFDEINYHKCVWNRSELELPIEMY